MLCPLHDEGAFRVASEIEKNLFGQYGTHGVVKITLAETKIVVSVAPWEQLSAVTTAEFTRASISSIYANGGETTDFDLPWDIIAFESRHL